MVQEGRCVAGSLRNDLHYLQEGWQMWFPHSHATHLQSVKACGRIGWLDRHLAQRRHYRSRPSFLSLPSTHDPRSPHLHSGQMTNLCPTTAYPLHSTWRYCWWLERAGDRLCTPPECCGRRCWCCVHGRRRRMRTPRCGLDWWTARWRGSFPLLSIISDRQKKSRKYSM